MVQLLKQGPPSCTGWPGPHVPPALASRKPVLEVRAPHLVVEGGLQHCRHGAGPGRRARTTGLACYCLYWQILSHFPRLKVPMCQAQHCGSQPKDTEHGHHAVSSREDSGGGAEQGPGKESVPSSSPEEKSVPASRCWSGGVSAPSLLGTLARNGLGHDSSQKDTEGQGNPECGPEPEVPGKVQVQSISGGWAASSAARVGR